jgi:hypothetical protein
MFEQRQNKSKAQSLLSNSCHWLGFLVSDIFHNRNSNMSTLSAIQYQERYFLMGDLLSYKSKSKKKWQLYSPSASLAILYNFPSLLPVAKSYAVPLSPSLFLLGSCNLSVLSPALFPILFFSFYFLKLKIV